jgi:hypothetical protein
MACTTVQSLLCHTVAYIHRRGVALTHCAGHNTHSSTDSTATRTVKLFQGAVTLKASSSSSCYPLKAAWGEDPASQVTWAVPSATGTPEHEIASMVGKHQKGGSLKVRSRWVKV